MNDGIKNAALVAAGFVLGGVAFAAVNSGSARKGCVSLVNKAIKLKEGVAYSLESMKEGVDDIVADAKAMDDESTACTCAAEEQA
jgi:hypothetical protein